MNAILAANPDLAAELDAEIARMKASKERLERERDEILAQKNLLEEQLRNAGIDIGGLDDMASSKGATKTDDVPQTLERSGR